MCSVLRTFVLLALLLVTSCQTPRAAPPPPSPPSQAEAPPPASPSPEEPPSSPPATPPAPPKSPFTVPATKAAEDGSQTYVDPPKHDATNVAGVFPGADSPEAAVVHYLASRVRHDERYREVLHAECSPRCARKLAEHDKWSFRAFHLVSRKQASPGKFWIKAWFEIEYKGKVHGGTDDFTVVEQMDGFRIFEVPT